VEAGRCGGWGNPGSCKAIEKDVADEMFLPDPGSVHPETPMKIARPARFVFRFFGIEGIFFVAGKSRCSPLS
jgi:hypothetical protein